jgi:hypothetical protein
MREDMVIKRLILTIDKEIQLLKKEKKNIINLRSICNRPLAFDKKKLALLKKAEIIESRVRKRQRFVLKILNKVDFKKRIEERIRSNNYRILEGFSRIESRIPKIIFPELQKKKKVDWKNVEKEINKIVKKGVDPLILSLKDLKVAIKKMPKSSLLKKDKKDPFLLLFHSTNSFNQAEYILKQQRRLPNKIKGRAVEYFMEVDLFWEKDNSLYFGHVIPGFVPKTKEKLLAMIRGNDEQREADPENFLDRKGLSKPEWLFPLLGKVKLVIEIKSGIGSDIKALDKLIKLIRKYNWEDQVVFYGSSIWSLEYLKKRLRKSQTILICLRGFIPRTILNIPTNKLFRSLLKWGFVTDINRLDFIDAFSNITKRSKKGVESQVAFYKKYDKHFFGGNGRQEEQIEWLLTSGAKGIIPWMSAKKLIKWVENK